MGASRIEPTGSNTGTGEMISRLSEHMGQESSGPNTGTGEMVSPPEDKYVAASTSATVDEGEAAVSPIEALTLRGTLDRSVDLRNPSGSGDESKADWVDVVRKQISLDTWGVTRPTRSGSSQGQRNLSGESFSPCRWRRELNSGLGRTRPFVVLSR